MSVLIKDMEMPKRCFECPLYDNYNYYCTLYSFGIPARNNRDGSTKPEWCELEELPSAQPENIRCYECKYGIHSGRGNVYICNVSPELVMEHTGDFYCGYAERKTDT